MSKGLIEVTCPCCKSTLKIDAATRAVISHKEPEKPRMIDDLAAAAARLKGEAGRREEAFEKSRAAHRVQADVLSKKFDELLRLAKEDPDAPPPTRDIDL